MEQVDIAGLDWGRYQVPRVIDKARALAAAASDELGSPITARWDSGYRLTFRSGLELWFRGGTVEARVGSGMWRAWKPAQARTRQVNVKLASGLLERLTVEARGRGDTPTAFANRLVTDAAATFRASDCGDAQITLTLPASVVRTLHDRRGRVSLSEHVRQLLQEALRDDDSRE